MTSIADLLLKARELHSVLGPVSSTRQFSVPPPPPRQNLRCFNCSAPGVTARNCQNCAERQHYREKAQEHLDTGLADRATEAVERSVKQDSGSCPRNYQRNNLNQTNQASTADKHPPDIPPTVKLMQRSQKKPVTCDVSINNVHVVAVVDTGASLSALRSSTLVDCDIRGDYVMPYSFSDIELADSTSCTPTGIVSLSFQLLGQTFTHPFAVVPNLSCPLLLATDFMIPADVHVHPATNGVWLGGKLSPTPDLCCGDQKELEGQITCMWVKDSIVDFQGKLQRHNKTLTEQNAQRPRRYENQQRERDFLLKDATESSHKCEMMKEQETQLKQQLSMYVDKFEEFQSTLAKSYEVFTTFRWEMGKMTKKIKRLERKTTQWRTKWENNNQALLQMAEEKSLRDSHFKAMQGKLELLERLCLTLRMERNDLNSRLSLLQEQGDKGTMAASEPGGSVELEKYRFDFLFSDPYQSPEGSMAMPFGHSHSVPHSHTPRYFLRPRHKPQVALG
ncbi:uncharacterized protein LOC121509765 [Cheilinus undulatus]|uniref:uncharacterized protein LOC121509765 n=1 Tax=Cheilinus undulatus TaxID=241271 RepID=UPI001BD4BF6C|nr:uncharacterized protein LOC121509765 [Cheilinus undulatus]